MSSKEKVVFTKKDVRDVLNTGVKLFVITSVVCVMLFFVNYVTKDRIAEFELTKINNAITALIGDDEGLRIDKADDYGEKNIKDVYVVTKGDGDDQKVFGYCVYVTDKGYGGEMDLLVGLTANGYVSGIEVISDKETAGIGKKVLSGDFMTRFNGRGGEVVLGEDGINAVSGATITSKAVTRCVNTVLEFYNNSLKEAETIENDQ